MKLKVKSPKYVGLFRLVVSIVALAMLGIISNVYYFRIDLTSDKRYTLNQLTKDILKDLKGSLYVKVYLDGDLPVGFTKMEKSLSETLDEFKVIANDKVQVEFVNPYLVAKGKKQEAFFKQLYDKGLQPTNVQVRDDDGGQTQRVIFPGALISYLGKETAVNLLHNDPSLSGDENIGLSIQNFEFNLVDAIYKLTQDSLPRVAFLQGHGEYDQFQTGDIERELSQYFNVDRVAINGNVGALNSYKVIIVAGPTKPFSETDKIAIDQYVMQGGRMLWFVDPVSVSIDSLSAGEATLAFVKGINLDDMLFHYGARLNPLLLQDVQCSVIPVNMAIAGQQPKFVPAPWVYYPLLSPPSNNPITRNLNLIQSKFVSPIDTVGANYEVKKRFLLHTSDYTKELQVPLLVDLSQVNRSPNQYEFNSSHLPVAVELSGNFTSVFRHRSLQGYNHGQPFNFVDKSVFTKQIVVADADIIRNEVQHRPNGAYIIPLGYDRFTGQTYGNKNFVMNMVKYLGDEEGLINLRSREYKLRMLNRKLVAASRLKWQLVNILFPSLILILGGILWFVIRKRLYS
ncbi:MAG TPA: gliding motility-associated ABC transporter substrate-binding protein GldG [Tenuifilaceae bacterium]|nr:gliding motility-associated ABC transporter substrate-binding protein GldG [Tenuifilaceae bacterium]